MSSGRSDNAMLCLVCDREGVVRFQSPDSPRPPAANAPPIAAAANEAPPPDDAPAAAGVGDDGWGSAPDAGPAVAADGVVGVPLVQTWWFDHHDCDRRELQRALRRSGRDGSVERVRVWMRTDEEQLLRVQLNFTPLVGGDAPAGDDGDDDGRLILVRAEPTPAAPGAGRRAAAPPPETKPLRPGDADDPPAPELPAPLFRLDRDGVAIVAANVAMRALLGRDAPAGLPLTELFDPRDRRSVAEWLAAARGRDASAPRERGGATIDVRLADGARVARLAITPGDARGPLVFAQDVTAAARLADAERELADAARRAAEADARAAADAEAAAARVAAADRFERAFAAAPVAWSIEPIDGPPRRNAAFDALPAVVAEAAEACARAARSGRRAAADESLGAHAVWLGDDAVAALALPPDGRADASLAAALSATAEPSRVAVGLVGADGTWRSLEPPGVPAPADAVAAAADGAAISLRDGRTARVARASLPDGGAIVALRVAGEALSEELAALREQLDQATRQLERRAKGKPAKDRKKLAEATAARDALLAAADAGLLAWDVNDGGVDLDARGRALLECGDGTLTQQSLLAAADPDDRRAYERRIFDALNEDAENTFDVTLRIGVSRRPVRVVGRALFDEAGDATHAVAAIYHHAEPAAHRDLRLAAESARDALREELDDARAQLAAGVAERDGLTAALDEARAALDAARRELDEARGREDALGRSLDELRDARAAADAAREAARLAHAEAASAHASATAERDAALADVEAARAEADALRAEAEAVRADRDASRAELEAERAALETARYERDRLADSVARLEGEQKAAAARADALRRDVAQMLDEAAALSRGRDEMAAELASRDGQLRAAEARLADRDRSAAETRDRIAELEAALAERAAALEGRARASADLEATAARLDRERAEADAARRRAEAEARAHEANVRALEANVRTLNRDRAKLEADAARAGRQAEAAQLAVQRAADERRAVEAARDALAAQLAAKESARAALDAARSELEASLAAREASIDSMRREAASLAAERDAIRRALALRSAELNAILELSSDAIRIRSDGRTRHNAAAAELFGEATSFGFADARVALAVRAIDDAPAGGRTLPPAAAMSGEPRSAAVAFVGPDGGDRRVFESAAPIRVEDEDGDDAVVGAVVIDRDLDESHRLESDLARLRRELAAIFGNTGVGVAHLDAGGRLLDANPQTGVLLGFGPAELRGRPIAELAASPGDRANLEGLLAAIREGELASGSGEFAITRRDGRPQWVSVTLARIEPGGAGENGAAVAALLQDVGEAHALRDAIAEADRLRQLAVARAQQVASTTGEGIAVLDPSAGVVDANDAARRLLAIGDASARFVRLDTGDSVPAAAFWARAAAGDLSGDYRVERQPRDARARTVRLASRRIEDDPRLTMLRAIDMTERAALEEELRRAQAQVVEAHTQLREREMLLKGNFVSAMQQLGAAAAIARPPARELAGDARLAAEARAAARRVADAMRVHERLVAHFNAAATNRPGATMTINKAPCDLHAVIDEAVQLLDDRFGAGGRVRRRLDAPRATVDADVALARHGLWSLFAHAASQSPVKVRGTSIVRTAVDDDRLVVALTWPTPRRDTAEVMVARSLLEQAGGAMQVRDADDGGTLVEVRFPLVDESAPAAPAAHPPATHVLLVEDHESTARVLSRQLARLNCSVRHVRDRAAARAALDEDGFALAVCDLTLPGDAALPLMRELRGRGVPTIALGSSPDDDAPLREIAVTERLAKPVDLNALAAAIRRLVGEGR